MSDRSAIQPEERLIAVLNGMLKGLRHVAVGNASPIPGAAAMAERELSGGRLRLTVLGSRRFNGFTDGGRELFDCAAQGRIDAFFLGGGEIDGQGNINLVGLGGYPESRVRFPGSFGSGYLYYVVPRVILFREEHTKRVMVPRVQFISAPGVSEDHVYRPGGPYALVTGLCVFAFDRARGRFRLSTVHPGHTVEEVRDCTDFDFDCPDQVPVTADPDPALLDVLRTKVSAQIAEVYPQFAQRLFGAAAA